MSDEVQRALIIFQQPEAPAYLKEPTNLYVDVELPDHLACEVAHKPYLLEDLAQHAFERIKRYWVMKIESGGMESWKPLQPGTVKEKQRQGSGTPTYPLVNKERSVPNLIRSFTPQVQTQQAFGITAAKIAFGPGPGQDLSPSERFSDLFWGSPKTPEEAMSYGKRGVIPPRPLYFNQAAREIIKEELASWAKPLLEPAERYCFEEAISYHADYVIEAPMIDAPISPSSKLGLSQPMYLLEGH